MDTFTAQKLIELNNNFYNDIAEDFSNTRDFYLKGWDRLNILVQSCFNSNSISVLDIGCGNARFYKYLKDTLPNNINYTGVDNNKTLLHIAKNRYKEAKFSEQDIVNFNIQGTYDLICAFGVTHHLPSSELRNKWFEYLPRLLNKNALLVLTFWHFNINKALNEQPNIMLDDNDFILGWKHKPNVKRYCHLYTKEEQDTIKNIFIHNGLHLISEYKEDIHNHENEWNDYLIMSN